jgi:hypothetical protein
LPTGLAIFIAKAISDTRHWMVFPRNSSSIGNDTFPSVAITSPSARIMTRTAEPWVKRKPSASQAALI